jgi:hypothetical protein
MFNIINMMFEKEKEKEKEKDEHEHDDLRSKHTLSG